MNRGVFPLIEHVASINPRLCFVYLVCGASSPYTNEIEESAKQGVELAIVTKNRMNLVPLDKHTAVVCVPRIKDLSSMLSTSSSKN